MVNVFVKLFAALKQMEPVNHVTLYNGSEHEDQVNKKGLAQFVSSLFVNCNLTL